MGIFVLAEYKNRRTKVLLIDSFLYLCNSKSAFPTMENTSDYKYDVFISYSRKDYVDENKNVLPHNVISQIKEPFAIGIVFSSSVYDNATLYVSSGTKSKYKATKGWWIFKNIVENDLLHIDGGQFVDTGNDIVNVYDLNGHRITSPQRGVNIMRLKDGTVRKVLVK